MEVLDVAVVGGGITGLAAANRLRELSNGLETPLRMAIYEGSDRFGGIISSERRDGFLYENGPDAFLSEKPHLLQLARRLNIESQIVPTTAGLRRSFVVWDRKFHKVPRGFFLVAPSRIKPFLASSLFSVSGKLRILAEVFVPPAPSGVEESVRQFVTRRFGAEAFQKAGQPLISGIYGGDPERLSLSAAVPKLRELEKKYGSVIRGLARSRPAGADLASGSRYNLFFSFKDGMSEIVQRLCASIGRDSLRASSRAFSAVYDTANRRWNIAFERGGSASARALVVATGARHAAALLGVSSPELVGALNEIRTESSVTVNLGYRKSAVKKMPPGFGFVVPRPEAMNFIGCTFANVKFPGRAPEGAVLLRAFAGGAHGRRVLEREDDEIIDGVRRDLEPLLGIRETPILKTICRHVDAMPQYEIGHAARIQRIRKESSQFPGLRLCGNYFEGVGLPDCVREGESAAESVMQELELGL